MALMHRYCWGSTVKIISLVAFLLGYLVIGALVFILFEADHEKYEINNLKLLRNEFLTSNPCVTDSELEEFIVAILKANDRGVSAARNVTGEPNWSFGQAMFFAGTILTTIGYGHVTPLSEGGKVFCVIYAAIGIPLTLIMFTALVERLMIPTSHLQGFLHRKLGHSWKPMHIRLLHVSIILLFLVIFIFLIPSAIFFTLEKEWNFLDAFYYCFISMTTIGLGDYIPGDHPDQKYRPIYKIATTFYLFIGLLCMMLTLANIYDVPELNIGHHFYLKSDEETDEQRPIRSTDSQSGPKYTPQVNEGYNAENREESRGAAAQQ